MRKLGSILLATAALAATACGGKTERIETVANITDPTSTGGDAALAGGAVTAFGYELFAPLRDDGNVVISPASVAIALAMLEPGATGEAQAQMDKALHIADRAAFHAGMTALRSSLESAEAPEGGSGYDPGELEIAIANATYMQDGYPVKAAYTDALSTYYGPLLHTVDFAADAPGVTNEINAFVKDATRDRIPKILGEPLDPSTVLALVNALYLKASWLEKFPESETADKAFTRLDGSKKTTPLMHGGSDQSTKGDGFVAARKSYSSRLAADFVLPDSGRFDDVAGRLGAAFAALDENPTTGALLVVPKLKTEYNIELRKAFDALGIKAAYEPGHLRGIADDDQLVLDQAVHATFIAVDEEGTEAAAATVLTARTVSAPFEPIPPVPVVLDRPYFFRIVDRETGATLFLGQILDPTAE